MQQFIITLENQLLIDTNGVWYYHQRESGLDQYKTTINKNNYTPTYNNYFTINSYCISSSVNTFTNWAVF